MSLIHWVTVQHNKHDRDVVVETLAESDDPAATLRELLEEGYDPNSENKGLCRLFHYTFNLLHIIAYCDDLNAKLARSCIPILVKAGVPVDERADGSYTALYFAVRGGRYAATDELLKAGADPGARQGLYRCIMHEPPEQLETVERLLQTGVDPSPPYDWRDGRRRREMSPELTALVNKYERLRRNNNDSN